MRLRQRVPEKELAGNFRFQPRNSIDRIYDSLSLRGADGKTSNQLIKESVKLERSHSIREEISLRKNSEEDTEGKAEITDRNVLI